MPRSGEVDAATRELVLERDGRHCRWCGTVVDLEVHHVRYKSQGGPGDEPNLITLCRRHHGEAHSNKRKWQPLLEKVLSTYYEQGISITVLQAARWR